MADRETVKKVAIIGSGLAGLTASYLLAHASDRDGNEVKLEPHLFEKSHTLGMDSASISVGKKNEFRIDVRLQYTAQSPGFCN